MYINPSSDNPPNDNPPNYDNPPNDNAPNDNPPNSYKRQSADKTIGRHDNPPKTINTSLSTLYTHASCFFNKQRLLALVSFNYHSQLSLGLHLQTSLT